MYKQYSQKILPLRKYTDQLRAFNQPHETTAWMQLALSIQSMNTTEF